MKASRIHIFLSLALAALVVSGYVIKETKEDENLSLYINDGGTLKEAIKITGSTGAVTIGDSGFSGTHTVNGSIEASNLARSCEGITVTSTSSNTAQASCTGGKFVMGHACNPVNATYTVLYFPWTAASGSFYTNAQCVFSGSATGHIITLVCCDMN